MLDRDEDSKSEQFNLFLEASSYSSYNIKEFAAAQELFSSKEKAVSVLEYPAKPLKLPLTKNPINKAAKHRKSERIFSNKSLSKRELGLLLSSFYGFNGLEHRAYPSAGASYALEIFCIMNNVDGLSGSTVYYNPDLHAVTKVGSAPSWKDASDKLNILVEGIPQCVFLFALFPDRLTGKYLERGGRFALIEVGAAMQQLALQISASKNLKGVAAGGMIDDYWLRILELDPDEAKIVLGYLCGK